MTHLLLPVGLGALFLALILLLLLLNERRTQSTRLAQERRRTLGLPEGKLVYEDADGRGESLTSRIYPLVGKPDYVVLLQDGRPVPIELKLNVQGATQPYSNHAVQIGSYCLLLEERFKIPPTHGILRYADLEFTVDYTPALRKRVLRLLVEMEQCGEERPPALARQRVAKCRVCSFQAICPVGRGK